MFFYSHINVFTTMVYLSEGLCMWRVFLASAVVHEFLLDYAKSNQRQRHLAVCTFVSRKKSISQSVHASRKQHCFFWRENNYK